MAMGKYRSDRKNKSSRSNFRSFWDWTGYSMPSFFDALSTQYYFKCEQMLFERYFPDFRGKKILKTDLWDEAKNTRILKWAADQGAMVYGLDISFPIVQETKKLFHRSATKHSIIVSDLRHTAFADESFDYIYSMGTIEHFREFFQAIQECFRVLKKGGVAIIGVPNKYDPFLRPVLVSFLYKLSLYSYGYEKSFSIRRLECMLEEVGFRILNRTGILFMPGALRMADLFLHVKWPKTTGLTAPLIWPFAYLYEKFHFLRRHGYLIACVAQKPFRESGL